MIVFAVNEKVEEARRLKPGCRVLNPRFFDSEQPVPRFKGGELANPSESEWFILHGSPNQAAVIAAYKAEGQEVEVIGKPKARSKTPKEKKK